MQMTDEIIFQLNLLTSVSGWTQKGVNVSVSINHLPGLWTGLAEAQTWQGTSQAVCTTRPIAQTVHGGLLFPRRFSLNKFAKPRCKPEILR